MAKNKYVEIYECKKFNDLAFKYIFDYVVGCGVSAKLTGCTELSICIGLAIDAPSIRSADYLERACEYMQTINRINEDSACLYSNVRYALKNVKNAEGKKPSLKVFIVESASELRTILNDKQISLFD